MVRLREGGVDALQLGLAGCAGFVRLWLRQRALGRWWNNVATASEGSHIGPRDNGGAVGARCWFDCMRGERFFTFKLA